MSLAIAINGSPRKHNGNTAMILDPLIQGMTDAGCEVQLFYAKDLQVKSCNCPNMYCWYDNPGKCCLKDDMDLVYPRLHQAEILVLATPVYIPLPGEMQNIINRLCPLMEPILETRDGRTRARLRENVRIRRILLVSTGGWWEEGNFETVTKIAEELAENTGVEFSGAIIRPHAYLMRNDGGLTEDGKTVIEAVRKAGEELVRDGVINQSTLDAIKRPLISQEELRVILNSMVK